MHEREGERDEVEAEPEARMADMRRAPPNCALANVPPCPNRAGASPAVPMPAAAMDKCQTGEAGEI